VTDRRGGVRSRGEAAHEGAPNEKGSPIMKLTTNTQVSVDGVVQANGGRNPDFDPGFERGPGRRA
jgi:hypothetical protein